MTNKKGDDGKREESKWFKLLSLHDPLTKMMMMETDKVVVTRGGGYTDV
jgi:hypothetical protein